MQRIAAGRRARRRRVLLSACGTMSALVLLLAGTAWGLTSYVNDAVGRVDAGTAGAGAGAPLNVLMAGVDLRSGLTRAQERKLHVGRAVSFNSDTMMLIHVSADRSRVTVVSLPRDSWVNIPGHGMGKINSAFGLGGPRLMVSTVERVTGLTINDFVEVNFLGFVKVIDALNGVNICLPQAVNDPYSGLRLSAGRHHVSGITALEYARDRHSFAASDLARIANQQSLLASLLKEAISSGTLANPVRLSRFLRAATSAIKVDQGLNVAGLADRLRGITLGDVRFLTVPLGNTNYQTDTGESAVLWNMAAAHQLFATLKADQPLTRKPAASRSGSGGTPASKVKRSEVAVDVYNGTWTTGLSATTGATLTQLGFRPHAGLTWAVHDVSQTLIEYPPGQQPGARLLQTVMPAATLRQQSGLARIRIILGTSGHTVATPGGAAPTSPPGAGSRTAAQDACK